MKKQQFDIMDEKLNIEFKKEFRINKEEYERQRKLMDGMIVEAIRRQVLIGENSMEIHAVIKVFVVGDEIKPRINEVASI